MMLLAMKARNALVHFDPFIVTVELSFIVSQVVGCLVILS